MSAWRKGTESPRHPPPPTPQKKRRRTRRRKRRKGTRWRFGGRGGGEETRLIMWSRNWWIPPPPSSSSTLRPWKWLLKIINEVISDVVACARELFGSQIFSSLSILARPSPTLRFFAVAFPQRTRIYIQLLRTISRTFTIRS